MKKHFVHTASLSVIALALAGCGGQETKPEANGAQQAPASDRAVAAVTNTLKAAAEATKAVAETAQNVAGKFDETISRAESLLASAKLPEALTSLDSLKGLALSPAQTSTVTALRSRIEQAIAVAKTASGEVTKAVADTSKAASLVSAKVTEAVAQAQSQLKAGKYQDALASLKPLADLKLDASQDKLISDLKAQIEKAIAATKAVGGEAGKAVGDLFNKK